MYTPWPDNSDKYALRSQLLDLVSDYLIVAPSLKVVDIHSRVAPVYMYEFVHRSTLSFGTGWMGVAHGDNVDYVFGVSFLPIRPYNATERNVSLPIMSMYANFFSSGDPSVSGITWERFNSSHGTYLQVNTNPKMVGSFRSCRMSLWNDYYPKLT